MKKDKKITETTSTGRKTRGISKPEVLMPVPANLLEMPEGYKTFFAGLKERITRERIKAVLSANSAMVSCIGISAWPSLKGNSWKVGAPRSSIDSPMT